MKDDVEPSQYKQTQGGALYQCPENIDPEMENSVGIRTPRFSPAPCTRFNQIEGKLVATLPSVN